MNVKTIIKGKLYDKFIDYASSKCDAVMFVYDKEKKDSKTLQNINKTQIANEKKFKNELLKKRNGSCWVYSKRGNVACNENITPEHPNYQEYKNAGMLDDPPGYQDLFEVNFYKFHSKIKKYLKENKNFYDWRYWKIPSRPEDISFFRNGYCWFYSVAHEEFCQIYCTEEEYNDLINMGIEFIEDHYINYEEYLYYEEY